MSRVWAFSMTRALPRCYVCAGSTGFIRNECIREACEASLAAAAALSQGFHRSIAPSLYSPLMLLSRPHSEWHTVRGMRYSHHVTGAPLACGTAIT